MLKIVEIYNKLYLRYLNIYYRKVFNANTSVIFLGKIDYYNSQNIRFGSDISINKGVFFNISSTLVVGNNVTISANVFITTVGLNLSKWPKKVHESLPIFIEDNVWIGAGSIILPGVRLAEGSVIGAGSVVTRDTEPYCVYGGVPAKKISGPIIKSKNTTSLIN